MSMQVLLLARTRSCFNSVIYLYYTLIKTTIVYWLCYMEYVIVIQMCMVFGYVVVLDTFSKLYNLTVILLTLFNINGFNTIGET